jgi:hypothetical protein
LSVEITRRFSAPAQSLSGPPAVGYISRPARPFLRQQAFLGLSPNASSFDRIVGPRPVPSKTDTAFLDTRGDSVEKDLFDLVNPVLVPQNHLPAEVPQVPKPSGTFFSGLMNRALEFLQSLFRISPANPLPA